MHHWYDPEMQPHVIQAIELTEYAAALAVTGAWRGTSRKRLYNEFGWENLCDRKCYRPLYHFLVQKNTSVYGQPLRFQMNDS